jgi:hypothetical protein
MSEKQTHIFLNPVVAEHAGEFERFLLDVVTPALREQSSHLLDRWRVLRATEADGADGAVMIFAFLFEGGDLNEEWNLNKLLAAHYGEQEGRRLLDTWDALFAPFQQWTDAITEPTDQPFHQVGWTFDPLRGDRPPQADAKPL